MPLQLVPRTDYQSSIQAAKQAQIADRQQVASVLGLGLNSRGEFVDICPHCEYVAVSESPGRVISGMTRHLAREHSVKGAA